jgi:2-polyprenyl-6-methoxyphenol hydroxylase-like FAD-dependent oxidoreductase
MMSSAAAPPSFGGSDLQKRSWARQRGRTGNKGARDRGGIGGLSAALCLHQQGIEVEVFEQADGIRELGVGINLLPHAVKELSELGLLERLDATGVRTQELIYCNRFGQRIWIEPRGLDAGYAWPQFSIHRGQLQGLLYQAARERIGIESLHVGHRLVGFDQGADGVVAHFAGCPDRTGDVLIGADGIHSVVRAQLYPGEGPPGWNGHMLWRGAVEDEPFLAGRSMILQATSRRRSSCIRSPAQPPIAVAR